MSLVENRLYELQRQGLARFVSPICSKLTAFLKSAPSAVVSPILTAFLIILPIISSRKMTISWL